VAEFPVAAGAAVFANISPMDSFRSPRADTRAGVTGTAPGRAAIRIAKKKTAGAVFFYIVAKLQVQAAIILQSKRRSNNVT
jgi:hypothetical protein